MADACRAVFLFVLFFGNISDFKCFMINYSITQPLNVLNIFSYPCLGFLYCYAQEYNSEGVNRTNGGRERRPILSKGMHTMIRLKRIFRLARQWYDITHTCRVNLHAHRGQWPTLAHKNRAAAIASQNRGCRASSPGLRSCPPQTTTRDDSESDTCREGVQFALTTNISL